MDPIYDTQRNQGSFSEDEEAVELTDTITTSGDEMAQLNANVYKQVEKSADDSSASKRSIATGNVRSIEDFHSENEDSRVQPSASSEVQVARDSMAQCNINGSNVPRSEHSTVSDDRIVTASKINVQTGERENQTLGSAGALISKNGKKVIAKRSSSLKKDKQLSVTARFMHEGMEILLKNDRSLLVIDNALGIEVRIEDPSLLDDTCSFEDAKQVLFSHLCILKAILDEQAKESGNCKKLLLDGLEDILSKTTDSRKRGIVYVKLLRVVNKVTQTEGCDYDDFLQEIKRSKYLSDDLKEHFKIFREEEERKFKQQAVLKQLGICLENDSIRLLECLRNHLTNHIEQHKSVLATVAPDRLRDLIASIPYERMMLITEKDVKLFAEMRSTLKEEIFLQVLNDLEDKWVEQVKKIKNYRPDRSVQLTNEIFFYLFKSLEEIILDIGQSERFITTNNVQSSTSGWVPNCKIRWTKEDSETKCLERQYNFILRLLNHFNLVSDCKRIPFEYKLQTLLKPIKRRQDPSSISDELYVWYCLIDDCLVHVLSIPNQLKSCILELYSELVHAKHEDKLEVVRVASRNIIHFCVQVAPYIASMSESESTDQRILRKQMNIMCFGKHSNRIRSRNLVEEFRNFWKCKRDIIDKLSLKMPIPEMKHLQNQFIDVVLCALKENAETESLLMFFRTFEDFISRLNRVPFDWYIKSIRNYDMRKIISLKMIKLICNKLSGTIYKSYQVMDLNKFVPLYRAVVNQAQLPKHYVIETLTQMVSNIVIQLNRKSWDSNEQLSETDQLSTSCELLSVIRRSLPYLRNQAEYASFELFYKEKVEAITFATKNLLSQQDFSIRCQLIAKSFAFEREQTKMWENALLTGRGKLNPTQDIKLLRQLYSERYGHLVELVYS